MTTLKEKPRKLLVVLNFWDGDHAQCAKLADLIADLEPTRNTQADILLYRRSDALPMEEDVRNKLLGKFAKVHVLKCRRLNATGYPCGCNEMFYDLLEVMRRKEWKSDYFAFLNMEADCVPVRPGWILALAKEYATALQEGFHAVGHMNSSPMVHLNGAAIYSIDFLERVGGQVLLGGPMNIAYDFHHAKNIVPLAKDTPLMVLDFNRKTITENDLFETKKFGVSPFFYHGVKDDSALIAVRSKWVDKDRDVKDLSDDTIFTYVSQYPKEGTEDHKVIEAWKAAWRSQGWNPVILTEYDAAKHAEYENLKALIVASEKTGKVDKTYNKWLALDYVGGGLMAKISVMPTLNFSPSEMLRVTGVSSFRIVNDSPTDDLIFSDSENVKNIIHAILYFNFKSKSKKTIIQTIIDSDLVKNNSTIPPDPDTKDCICAVSYDRSTLSNYSPGTPLSTVYARHNDKLFI